MDSRGVIEQNWHAILHISRNKIIFTIVFMTAVGFFVGMSFGYTAALHEIKKLALSFIELLQNSDTRDYIFEGLARLKGDTTEQLPKNYSWNLTKSIS